jgi:hypothetical protein
MDRVISLKSWLGAVFARWRILLFCAILAGALFGGKQAYQTRPSKVAEQQKQASAENDATQKAYAQGMKQINEAVAKRNQYIANSLKTQINPSAEGRASFNLYVTTEALKRDKEFSADTSEASPASGIGSSTEHVTYSSAALREANQILDAYSEFIQSGIKWDALAKKMGTKAEYLQELVLISSIDENNVKILVYCLNPKEEGAKEEMDYLLDQVRAYQSTVTKEFGAHEIKIRNQNVATVVDTTLMRYLSDRIGDVNNLITNQDNFKINMNSSGQQAGGVKVQNRREYVISCGKAAVKGFVIGAVIFILIYGLFLILSQRILSGQDLNRQYRLKKLAAIPDENILKKKGLDRLSKCHIIKYYSGSTKKNGYQVAAESISQMIRENGVIGLTGDLSEAELQMVSDALSAENRELHYEIFCNLSQNPEALHKLKACDGIVLLAKIGQSRYSSVEEILEALKTYQSPILGSIII